MNRRKHFLLHCEACYAWDERELNHLEEKLHAEIDLDTKQIQVYCYFKRRFFARRVIRRFLPPSRLYWRICAVYECFGPKVDSKSGKALFNKDCWVKAKGVLNEVMEGYYSDPPGEEMYKYELTKSGEVKRDSMGILLQKCKLDTNLVVNYHKNLSTMFGSHPMGLAFADDILAESSQRFDLYIPKE